MAPTQALSLQHTHLVQEKMLQLGWLVNLKKSQLNPSQSIEHLGMNLDTKNMSISIPGKKIRSIRRQAYQLLYQTQVKVKQLAAFIGSALATQLGNQQARSSNPHQWTQICTITPLMRKDLLWWITQLRHWNGRQMLPHRPTIQVFTDSSDRGWGIVHEVQQYQGQWTPTEQSQHINYKELLVVWKMLSITRFHPHQHIQLCMDNTSAIAYINKFGGTRSSSLNQLALRIWTYCFANHIHLSTLYVPSLCNPADAPSRQMIQQNDWALSPLAYQQLDQLWGPHHIDLFASPTNTKIPHNFVSWDHHPTATWTNAFSRDWTTIAGRLYMCPPWNLIQRILLRLKQQPRPATLITPNWPSAPWWPTLQLMTISRPHPLPPSALSAHHLEEEEHPHQKWNLIAWNL